MKVSRHQQLTPETAFCPNFDCAARGRTGEGNIGVHSQKDRLSLAKMSSNSKMRRLDLL